MKAITNTEHGSPDVLEVREFPDPDVSVGDVKVDVRAAGFNFAELIARQGLYEAAPDPPFVAGFEAAGEVTEVGDDVDDVEPGERVIVMSKFGSHVDTLSVPRDQIFKIPDEMSFKEAAAIPVNYLTAYHMMFYVGNLHPGEHLLIHAVAGGVGIAATQLAQTVDEVTVYGTASPQKHEIAEGYGCDHTINYREKDYKKEVEKLTDGEGVHMILDALGGRDWKKGYELLRPTGRLMAFGFSNMITGEDRNWLHMLRQYVTMPFWRPWDLIADNKAIAGIQMLYLWDQKKMLRRELNQILDYYERGIIEPHIDSARKFEDAADAHKRMQNRKNIGKQIFVPE